LPTLPVLIPILGVALPTGWARTPLRLRTRKRSNSLSLERIVHDSDLGLLIDRPRFGIVEFVPVRRAFRVLIVRH